MMQILVGTVQGLFEIETEGRPRPHSHPGKEVTAVQADGTELWAIVDGAEVWWRRNGTEWIHRGTLEGLRANCIAATRAGVLVGTSAAHLYRVTEEGPVRVDPFDRAPGREDWYTPWGGPPDSRSISEDDDAIFVNVHVGGILRTFDAGATWEPTIDIHADVHKVLATPDRLYAACAGGLAVSGDRGGSWTMRAEGLHATYCRGVAVCGGTVLVSASNGPGGTRSGLYRGEAVGGDLERCRAGLPQWFDGNIDSSWLDALPDGRLAAFASADRTVFASVDAGANWMEVASGLPAVRCLAVTDPGLA